MVGQSEKPGIPDGIAAKAAGASCGSIHAAGDIGAAITDSGRAHDPDVRSLGSTLGGVGHVVVSQAGGRLRTWLRAGSLREVAEMRAVYPQQRIEIWGTRATGFVDEACVKSGEVAAPLHHLPKKAA